MTFPRTRKIAIPLIFAIGLIVLYFAIFGKATATVYRAKLEAARTPALAAVPVQVHDVGISPEKGKPESFFGFGFDVPWNDSVVKDGDFDAMVLSPSRQQAVMFVDPSAERGLVSLTKDTPGLRPELIYSLYGEENAASDYQLAWSALNATPSQLSLIMPGEKQLVAANLLRMKKAYLGQCVAEIYSFTFGDLRGFQHRDPDHTKIVVDAYDDQDHKFTFIFTSGSDPQKAIKQADINRILQTFHAVPDNDD